MSDTPKTLAAILAEMRDPCAPRAPSLPALADRIETAVQRFVADDCAKCAHYNAATISLKDALDLANTIANHGTNANGLGDKASATIYALCHEVRTVRVEDANIKQEVQKLRRELRDLRRAPGNASACAQMTLDEAIAHAESRADETPCGQAHAQLAGWLRELRDLRSPGNAAALREALNRVERLANDLSNITERDTEVRADVNEIVDACRAALAAPARNCDRFATEDESREAYWAYRDPLEFNDKPFVSITEWLFAPAEGGDHA